MVIDLLQMVVILLSVCGTFCLLLVKNFKRNSIPNQKSLKMSIWRKTRKIPNLLKNQILSHESSLNKGKEILNEMLS